jgi:hypothetical protein
VSFASRLREGCSVWTEGRGPCFCCATAASTDTRAGFDAEGSARNCATRLEADRSVGTGTSTKEGQWLFSESGPS